MADFIETLYTPPAIYQQGYKGADEIGDLRYLHASAAVIRVGGVPVVAIENLNVSQQTNRSPIFVIGSPAPIGFDFNGTTVNVSGQMIQMANMSLNQSSFYSKDEADIVANINRVFNIDILMMDPKKEDAAEFLTEPFLTIKNCQTTGSSIVINPNTNIKDSFTAVGTFMIRDFDQLATFNQLVT